MIQDTLVDLATHLQDIEEKLEALKSGGSVSIAENQLMQNERTSTQQCLRICEDARSRIQALQTQFLSPPTAKPGHLNKNHPDEPQIWTHTALSEFGDRMTQLIGRLQERLDSGVGTQGLKGEDTPDRLRLQEEIEMGTQCLAICNLASSQTSRDRVHVLEDISVADRSQQVIVSTIGDLIHAKKVAAGNDSTQWVGSMTDASLQQLSQDRRTVQVTNGSQNEVSSQKVDESHVPTQDQDTSTRKVGAAQFTNRHGTGRKLDL
jgi:hypothetical protein